MLELSGVALWTNWKMQQILIDNTSRMCWMLLNAPQDLEIYSK